MHHTYSILEKILFGTPKHPNEKQFQVLKNKTILITGATHGIGRILSRYLANINCTLILVGRTEENLKYHTPHKANIYGLKCDLTNKNELNILIQFISDKQIDFFINNAGRSMKKRITDSNQEDASKVMNLHYNAPSQLITEIIKKDSYLTIINTTSASTLFPPTPQWGHYNASKIAFSHWLDSLTFESTCIKVKHLFLPLVNTRMIPAHSTYSRFPKMSAYHAATIIISRITSSKKHFYPWWLRPSSFIIKTLPFLWKPITKLG